jgi:hypothetical protein
LEGEDGVKVKKRAKNLLIISESKPPSSPSLEFSAEGTVKSVSLWSSPQALLNLCGDFLHNFTDGLAIGGEKSRGSKRLAKNNVFECHLLTRFALHSFRVDFRTSDAQEYAHASEYYAA